MAVTDASLMTTGAGKNYSVAAGGSISSSLASINTLRYTGGGGTIVFTRNNTGINGVMNAGAGTLTLNALDSSLGRIITGDSGALVFNAASGNISVGVNRLLGSRVVKTGAHELLISTANGLNFTGGLYVNQGTVTAVQSGLGSNGTQLGAGAAGGLSVASGSTVNMDAFNANSTITYAFGALTGDGTVNVHTGGGTATTRFSGSLAAFSGVLNVSYKNTSGKVVLDLLNAAGVGSAARINVANNGTLQLEGGITVAAALTLGGGDTSESLGQLRLEGDSVYSGDVTLTAGVDSNDYTIGSNSGVGGTISGNVGESGGSMVLSKGGGGTVALTGTNTYTGATLVAAGNLQVGKNSVGSTHASSLVSVNGTTAILSGTGTLHGATTVVKGKIRPGDAGGQSRGTLNFGNGLTFSPAVVATIAELSIHGTSLADQTGDRIHITGDFTLNDKSNIVVTPDAGFVPTAGQSWILIDWTGVLHLNGWNAGLLQRDGSGDTGSNFDLPDIASSGLYWEISALQDGATGGALVASIAPEPSRMLLLAAGAAAAMFRRRRRMAV